MCTENKEQKFTKELFLNPPAEFRGAPFWAWNTDLKEDVLLWQIDRLKEMGFGGFFIHTRSGMSTEYLGKDFMRLVSVCNNKSKDIGMLSYLYDEDRWPSGARRNAQSPAFVLGEYARFCKTRLSGKHKLSVCLV